MAETGLKLLVWIPSWQPIHDAATENYHDTENSRYKHTVGTGGGMLITNICLYREKIIYMRKLTNVTGIRY